MRQRACSRLPPRECLKMRKYRRDQGHLARPLLHLFYARAHANTTDKQLVKKFLERFSEKEMCLLDLTTSESYGILMVSRATTHAMNETQHNERKRTMTTNTNETKNKRHRATRDEMLAKLKAKIAKIEAQQAGAFNPETEDGYMVKRLNAAIRRRETVLKAAGTLINGRAATQSSPMLPPIATKIANAETRLASLRADLAQAEAVQVAMPGDIERLTSLLAQVEAGETVEFPTDLFPLPDDSKRSDAQIEAASVSV